MTKRLSAGFGTVLLLMMPVSAQCQQESASPILSCSKISGALERLDCYDGLAKRQAVEANAPPTPTAGNAPSANTTNPQSSSPPEGEWLTARGKNPMDDKPTYTALLLADSGSNKDGKLPKILMRCRSGKFEFYINWDTFVNTEGVSVTTRVDDKPAKTQRWSVSTDNTAGFHPAPAAFLSELSRSKRLIVSVTPYSANPIVSVFDLTGIQRVEAGIRELCRLK